MSLTSMIARAVALAMLAGGLEAQQTGIVAGAVVDSATGQARRGVTATIVGTGQRATTNEQGRFVIPRVPTGPQSLQIRAIGYRVVVLPVSVRANDTTRVDVALATSPLMLRAMRIDAAPADREAFETKPNVGSLNLTARAMEAVPRFGEADLVRVVQLAPGVQARNDFSTGFNVRGGEADQNLILIDNYPIYNPFHLGGLFSTFIGSTVSDIQLLTGAFPARYGGRLSSVLDVRSAEEARPGVHGSAEVSALAATGAAAGAFDDGNGSWVVAGRRTYADKVIQLLSAERIPYHFRDEQAHLAYRLPSNSRLSVTLYDGRDILDGNFAASGSDRESASGGDFFFSWGNLVGGATLSKWLSPAATVPVFGWRLGDSSTMEQRLSTSRFSTSLDLGSGSESFQNSLSDTRVGGALTTFTKRHDRTIGYEAAFYDIRYGTTSTRLSVDPHDTRQRPTVGALYLDDLWRPTPSILIDGGARLESLLGGTWTGISPRVSMKYLTSSSSAFTAAVGRFSQWTHSVAIEDDPIRLFDYWRASDENAPVSTAWHFVAGHERWLNDKRFGRVEAFYKRYDLLLEANPSDDPTIEGDEFAVATGTSYGGDLLLRQYEVGPFSGWLAYSYAVSRRQQDSIRYVPAHDRRHDVNLVVSWRIAKFIAGARIGYASGTPYTETIGQTPRRHYDPVRNLWGTGGDNATWEDIGAERNGARLPPTRRIDLHLQRTFQLRGASIAPYASVVNATNAHNVLFYLYDFSTAPATRLTVSQFPLVPSAGVTIVF